MGGRKIETAIELRGHSPADVWSVFSQFQAWKDWCTFMDVQEPPTQVGKPMRVQFKVGGSSPQTASPQVLVLEPEKELRWRGRLFGSDWWFVGEHYFRFAPLPERKGTKLEHGEQFSGLLVGLLGAMLTQTEKEFQGWNEQLKATLDAGKERGRR